MSDHSVLGSIEYGSFCHPRGGLDIQTLKWGEKFRDMWGTDAHARWTKFSPSYWAYAPKTG